MNDRNGCNWLCMKRGCDGMACLASWAVTSLLVLFVFGAFYLGFLWLLADMQVGIVEGG